MTAEIAVMNKSAVALAADSAVTIGSHPNVKVYNGINKLFALSKICPVGIMVYGQAEFMGVPWEPIIKLYRRHLGKQTFDTLKQYADNFIAFIETHAGLFSESHQAIFFQSLIGDFFQHIVYHIDNDVRETISKKGNITEGQVKSIAGKNVKELYDRWSLLPHLDTVPANHAAAVTERYSELLSPA